MRNGATVRFVGVFLTVSIVLATNGCACKKFVRYRTTTIAVKGLDVALGTSRAVKVGEFGVTPQNREASETIQQLDLNQYEMCRLIRIAPDGPQKTDLITKRANLLNEMARLTLEIVGSEKGSTLAEPKTTTSQVMEGSPGSVQIGGDLNIQVDAGRKLTNESAVRITQHLRAYAPWSVKLTIQVGDVEAGRLRDQLTRVFDEAGWRVLRIGESTFARPISGLEVHTSTPPTADLMEALEPLFQELGYQRRYVRDPHVEASWIEVVIGWK